MKTSKSVLTGTSFGLVAALSIGFGAPAAHAAKTECYDFSDLRDGPNEGGKYLVGDTINAKHALITLKNFHSQKGTPVTPENPAAQFAKPGSGHIAQGAAPELHLYLINAEVKPDAPVKKVTLKFAEAIGGAYTSNIEVNGEKHVVNGSLATANGKVIGKERTGKAAIVVNIAQPAAPPENGFNRGTLELHATKGAIETFSIGGHQHFIDDVCMTKS